MEFETFCGGIVYFLNRESGFAGFVPIVTQVAFGFSVEGEGGDIDQRVGADWGKVQS